jgi:DNA-binding NarL/FixJ family response regulator
MTAVIADDEEDMRVLIRGVIEEAGWVVSGEAADGEEAVRLWRESAPDAVVLDQRMPRLTGLDAAKQILIERHDQPVILFSAFVDHDLQRSASSIGICSVLSKSAFLALPAAIRRCVGRGSEG